MEPDKRAEEIASQRAARLRAEYEICKVRGHKPSGFTLTCNPPLSVCALCGTEYRTEMRLVEQNVPPEVTDAE